MAPKCQPPYTGFLEWSPWAHILYYAEWISVLIFMTDYIVRFSTVGGPREMCCSHVDKQGYREGRGGGGTRPPRWACRRGLCNRSGAGVSARRMHLAGSSIGPPLPLPVEWACGHAHAACAARGLQVAFLHLDYEPHRPDRVAALLDHRRELLAPLRAADARR